MASGLRSMESNHQQLVVLRCKVVVVGDACVGKSALTQVFHSGGATYPKNYLMTIGAEFCVKQVPIPDTNYIVELYIYDCSGQSIFNQLEMNNKYLENASAVMVVFSVGDRSTFQSTNKWLTSAKQVTNATTGPGGVIGVLVGNKSDFRDGSVDSRAEVSANEAQSSAAALRVPYFESSAAKNTGVEEPFKHIAQEFHKRYEESLTRMEDLASNLVF